MKPFNQVFVGSTPAAGNAAPCTLLAAADGRTALLFNSSSNTTVWLTESNTASSTDAGGNGVSPLRPQEAVVCDGTVGTYGVCAAGQNAVVNVYPGVTSYTPADQLSRLPLLVQADGMHNIPGGATTQVTDILDVSGYNSYDFAANVYDSGQNIAGHPLCLQWTVTFFDDSTQGLINFPPQPCYQETWNTWVTPSPVYDQLPTLIASGPVRGRYMQLSVTNGSTSPVIPAILNLFGSPRVVLNSDWRMTAHGFTPNDASFSNIGNGDLAFSNVLASVDSAAVAVNAHVIAALDLFSGPVYYRFSQTAAAAFPPVIVDIGSYFNLTQGLSGGLQAGTASPGILVALANITGEQDGVFYAPRSACALLIKGPSSGTYACSFRAVAQQSH